MGQLGSTRCKITQECPIATKFGRKNSLPESNTLLGRKSRRVSWGQLEVENALNMANATLEHMMLIDVLVAIKTGRYTNMPVDIEFVVSL